MSPDFTSLFQISFTDLKCLDSVVLIKSLFVKFNVFVNDLKVSDISSQNIFGSLFFFASF